MNKLAYLIPLILVACAPSTAPLPVQPPVVIAPQVPPVVTPPVVVPEGTLVTLGNLGSCELLSRQDDKIPYRYWLYTKDCNAYYNLKWFASLESQTSLTYIGMVGYDSQVYIDTVAEIPFLFIKSTPAGGDQWDDSKNVFSPLLKVNFSQR